MNLFEVIVTQPIYNLIVGLYDLIPGGDLGLAIIATTIVVKMILFPLTYKSLKSQKDLKDVQPKIAEIREKYKLDKERQAKELMAVYKEHNVNPFASCLPLLIQLPVFLVLFNLLKNGFATVNTDLLYSWVSAPEVINQTLFNLVDLSAVSIPIAALTAVAQYLQMKQTIRRQPPKAVAGKPAAMDESMTAAMNNTMLYFLPIFTLIIGSTSLPGGVTLYWLTTTVITVAMYYFFFDRKSSTDKTKTQD